VFSIGNIGYNRSRFPVGLGHRVYFQKAMGDFYRSNTMAFCNVR